MSIQKWNPATQKYDPYQPPKGYISMFETDMDKLINCAGCGSEITFGECYTSMQIHNSMGMGYSVCESCHEAELKEEMKYRGRR